MKSVYSSPLSRPIKTRTRSYPLRIMLPVCLLFFAVAGQVLAASGSTRLTIRLDQSVVDAIARWKGETVQAEGMLQRLLPAARAGLGETHQPQAVRQIIEGLQRDVLMVCNGRAEHSGSAGGAWVTDHSAAGRHTVHSI